MPWAESNQTPGATISFILSVSQSTSIHCVSSWETQASGAFCPTVPPGCSPGFSVLERQHESTGLGVRGPGFVFGPFLCVGPEQGAYL